MTIKTDSSGLKNMLLVVLLAVLAASSCSTDQKPESVALTDADIADNNRGVALMGYFDYAGARDVFQTLVDRQPQWLDARVNLAIATLNRQEAGDEELALDLVADVLRQDPMHLRAHYVSGLLRQNRGDIEIAREHFQTVADADPDDAYASYYLGQALKQLNRTDDALVQYRRAMQQDPYLRSAYYGAALALRQSGQADEANAMLDAYKRFENNPRARLAELKYTRMGPKAAVQAIDLGSAVPAPVVPDGELFASPLTIAELPPLGPRSALTTVDIDGDGDQDLFISRVGPDDVNAVIRQDNQSFVPVEHPLAPVSAVNAVAWGDFNNDGLVDAYLCRNGANQLWRQDEEGWTDISVETGTSNGQYDCADALMIDADHDGDLDVFVVNRDGPNELYNNNLDGSFRPLAGDYGISGRTQSLGAIAGDLDNDRDLDLIVIKSEPPHEIFLNDRLWQYTPVAASSSFSSFVAGPVSAATLADSDTDGQVEVFAVHSDGAVYHWLNKDNSKYRHDDAVLATAPGNNDAQIAVTDFDGDGKPEIMRVNNDGWEVYAPAGGKSLATGNGELSAVLPVYMAAATGPDLFVAQRDGTILRYPAGAGRHAFAAFRFSGKEQQADSMRSNRDGVGTRVEFRVGSNWTIVESLDRHSAPGQSLQPLMLGLAGATRADFAALTWSDGVYQTELDLAAAQLHRIEETQRQLSSCPVLFAWDGENYQFVTDLLGVGGLGFFVEPGVVATPRPWEYLLLPPQLLQEKDGLLSFKLTEPMEELAYIDLVRLHVYDLPVGLNMVLDERMVIEGPAATGEALFYEKLLLPIQALNQQGIDVTQTVLTADRVAAPPGPLDQRFIGRLADTQVITLDFAKALNRQDGTPLLIVEGWLEYPYSQTVFAAWQAGASFDAPTLEAFGQDGRWQTIYTRFGYPAGMPRQMVLPLRDLPAGTMRLRLSTNQEIYWDQIAVAHTVEASVGHFSTVPISATQRLTGFPHRTTASQRVPDYDYSRRDSFWDTRYPRGQYSEFGSVIDLVQRTDDAVAIIGPGEEIEFSFAIPEIDPDDHQAAVSASTVRRYVLEVRGWAKDMDLYTRDGETVAPLPVRDPTQTADDLRDALHRRYHTRYQSGR